MMRLPVVFVALLLTLFAAYSSANETHYVELDPSAGGAAITIRMEDYYASSVADAFELVTLPEGGSLYQTDSLGQKSGPAITVVQVPVSISGLGGSLVFESSAATYPLVASFNVKAMKAATEVSSDTIKVLLHHCIESIPDLNPWGGNVSPPAPTSATIVYNPSTQRFDVAVETAYLRDNAVYVIDFANFDPNADDIRTVTTCTNRVALTEADFDTLFLSAPDASFTGALDGSEFLAYSSAGSLWSVTATNCGKLRYAASLTFTQLQACQMRRSSSSSITVSDGTTEISYSGTLYVNVIEPLDSTNANAGYEKTQFAYPFAFTYSKTIDTLSTVTSNNDFSVAVNSVTLDSSTGNLAMVITTTYVGTSLDFDSVVLPESNGATLTLTRVGPACSSSPCIEKWDVTSASAWITNNNGDYTFKFKESASPTTTVWGIITIRQSLNAAQQGSFTFANALAFYANEADFLQGAPALVDGEDRSYGSSRQVFVREEVTVANGDRSKFKLTIVNAWICYTTISNFEIKSCTDPFLTDKERFQLVISGGVNPAFNRFDTVISNWPDTAFTDTTKLAAGISFQALPLAFQSHNYTVHLQVRIADVASNRRRQERVFDRVTRSTIGKVGNFIGAFSIDPSDDDVPDDSGSVAAVASAFMIAAGMLVTLY